jgi:uncharacterized phage protein (TIGR01671 family)
MNRMIKFRAWHKEGKYMFDMFGIGFARQLVLEGKGEEVTIRHDLDDVELMQYTERQDKHGNDIYDGDIVIVDAIKDNNIWPKTKNVIKYASGAYIISGNNEIPNPLEWKYLLGIFSGNQIEVIGNIWENPELLKGDL